MAPFGENLFARTPFLFWTLTPVLLLGAAAITFPLEDHDRWQAGVTVACDVVALLLVLGLWPYHPIPYVQRILAGLVGAAIVVYALSAPWPDRFGPLGAAPPGRLDALIGLGLVGLPCLWFAARGRWPSAPEPELPVVAFDEARVVCSGGRDDDFAFRWDDVARIGYRTLDTLGPDHFLEFQLRDGRTFAFPFGWPGVVALDERVRSLRDTRLTARRGNLANVIGNDSIVIWPASEAGGPLG